MSVGKLLNSGWRTAMSLSKLINLFIGVNINFLSLEVYYNPEKEIFTYIVSVEADVVHSVHIKVGVLFSNNVDMTKYIFSKVYKKIREINIKECI